MASSSTAQPDEITPAGVADFSLRSKSGSQHFTAAKMNARLKTLCWKLGESFVKVSGKEGATYGKLYAEFKAEEQKRNDAGLYAAAAAKELASKKITDAHTKAVLQSGRLIDGHLHSRAKRRAVKIFLAHYWTKGREARGLEVRAPYSIQILGHDGEIAA